MVRVRVKVRVRVRVRIKASLFQIETEIHTEVWEGERGEYRERCVREYLISDLRFATYTLL